jgi:hypothetical protein
MLSPVATACSTMDTQQSPCNCGTTAWISVSVQNVVTAAFAPNMSDAAGPGRPRPRPRMTTVSPVAAGSGAMLVIAAPSRGWGRGRPAAAMPMRARDVCTA